MFRDTLPSRSLLVGLVFFVLVVGSSLLYSWHIRRISAEEQAQTNKFAKQYKEKNKAPAENAVQPVTFEKEGFVGTPLEIEDTQWAEKAEVLRVEDTESLDFADAFLPDDFVSEEAPAENVPVSPYGFGPYPDVPLDYPSSVLWEEDDHGNLSQRTLKNIELIDRVLVKLWSEGERGFKGGAFTNGKVYPYYHQSIYVRYDEDEGHQYISEYYGGPEIPPLTPKQLYDGQLPAGIHIIDMGAAGIDAYSFLDF